MQNNKDIFNYLGLIARARKMSTGESALKAIQSQKASFVIIANDASENTKKKYIDKCNYYNVDYMVFSNVDELSHAIGKANRVVIAIIDNGFGEKLKEKLGG